MQIQYFKSAWGDIKNSPGWFGKLCLLALLSFIPVFGQIVTFAYLYGWAREIAWGTHEPMPARIFANEDGKFWRRGWFLLVLAFVFTLVPQVVMQIGDYWQVMGMGGRVNGVAGAQNPVLVGVGGLLSFVGFAGAVVLAVLAWIGSMRIAIYDRLSAGFQLGKIWKMLRFDTNGILKIFGMNLIVSLVLGVIVFFLAFMVMFIVVAAGVAGLVGAGYSVDSFQYMSDAQALRMFGQFVASAGVVGVLAVLLLAFATMLASAYVDALIARALGYWTLQFDVPRWGGQDEPLPFERAASTQAAAPTAPTAPAASAVGGAAAAATQVAPAVAPVDDAAPEQPYAGYGEPDDIAPQAQASAIYGDEARFEEDMPVVEYGEPLQVGAGFIMTPEQIEEAQVAMGHVQSAASDAVSEAEEVGAGEVSEMIEEPNAPQAPLDGLDAEGDERL